MIISGMIKSSLIDFPGLVACVVFVPGCNYDCFYCHNRALIEKDSSIIDRITVMDFLKKRAGLLDGVVITGGEATLQKDLIPFMHSIKTLGYKIKLDTNGSRPQIIANVLKSGLCDYFAVDYKAPASKYAAICGQKANAIPVLETIHLLLDAKADFEVRTTVIPQLSLCDLKKMAAEFPIVDRYILNRYVPPKIYPASEKSRIEKIPYTQNRLSDFVNMLRPFQPNVRS